MKTTLQSEARFIVGDKTYPELCKLSFPFRDRIHRAFEPLIEINDAMSMYHRLVQEFNL